MLVCPEPLGHGQPAGIGIRFVEIARVLRDDGHSVTVLSPDAGQIDGCTSHYINPQTLLATSQSSDVAVVQGHVANAFFLQAAPIPTVVDLYDPYIIENLHYYAERGAEVFQHDHFTLLSSLARGDFFLCASEAQRMFYLGALLAAGRLNPAVFEADPELRKLIDVAPFGVGRVVESTSRRVDEPQRQRLDDSATPRLADSTRILFGGIYDWYDPILAIEAAKLVDDATLTFTHHPNPELTPQGKLAEAMEHVRANKYGHVRFEPWAPYEERAAFFERFDVALLTFPRSLETDLSMRTRVYDYLWCGLPIVTSSAPGTDEILARYNAGVVVYDETPQAFADAIRNAPRNGEFERFVREHQWPETLAPLRAFCRAPRFDRTKDAFAMRPSIPERPVSILRRLKRRLRA
ncbi:MAG TPA: glycosyltransferase family 4 protein [Thermoanaerobaculia bacterium]|nr:glycosyltransferase family 4 protein [Thermoanaerobaculia bacterium]